MSAPVKLIPLRCLHCDTPVPAQPEEVAWVCAQCGQGLLLDEYRGLTPLEIYYMAGITTNARGKPFWVAEGKVALRRETYKSFGGRTGEAERFWGVNRRFFVPAFTCPQDTLIALGTQYLSQPPGLQPGPPVAFEPVTLPVDDMAALAEFIVLGIEAERKDDLRTIQVSVELGPAGLWILP